MPTFTLLTSGLGGLGFSYASIQDLDNLSLPRSGSQATIDSNRFPSNFLLSGKTLRFQITVDGIVSTPVTFTFPANYTSLDQAVAAFSVGGLVASNNAGRFRVQTLKYGYDQGIHLFRDGTANPFLELDDLQDTDERGISSKTKEFTDDDKAYQLVMASAEADSYIARRTVLPLKNWDMKLVEVVCDIAAYKLMFRDGYSPAPGSYDRNYEERYKMAIQYLSDVGNRNVHPIWAYGKPIPTIGSGYGPIFSDPRGWGVANGTSCGGCGCGPGYGYGWLGYGN